MLLMPVHSRLIRDIILHVRYDVTLGHFHRITNRKITVSKIGKKTFFPLLNILRTSYNYVFFVAVL